jgi:hypothetical protein
VWPDVNADPQAFGDLDPEDSRACRTCSMSSTIRRQGRRQRPRQTRGSGSVVRRPTRQAAGQATASY